MSDILNEELNSAFIEGQKTFKGEPLAPYTEGSRLLMLQVRDEADSSIFFVWTFMFLHIHLAKDKRETIRLAWDKNAFRESVLNWVENKTEQDRIEATNIVAKIIEDSQKGQVETISSGIKEPGNA